MIFSRIHKNAQKNIMYTSEKSALNVIISNLKCLYFGVMKGSYFGFGSPHQQADMHARSKRTLSFSYNMHLFLPYLLNDSQTIRSTIHLSKPLLCVTLICGDWSISFKAVFVSF